MNNFPLKYVLAIQQWVFPNFSRFKGNSAGILLAEPDNVLENLDLLGILNESWLTWIYFDAEFFVLQFSYGIFFNRGQRTNQNFKIPDLPFQLTKE